MRLLTIPGASVRRAQCGHQFDECMKSFRHRGPHGHRQLGAHYTRFPTAFNRLAGCGNTIVAQQEDPTQDAQTGLFCLSRSSGLSGLPNKRDKPNKPNNGLLLLAGFFSVLLCVLRLFRAYGRVPSLHLERGKGLWPQNRKKDLSFGIGGVGVTPTVLPPRHLPSRRYSPINRLHTLIRTRIREFLSPFHPSSFLWAAPR